MTQPNIKNCLVVFGVCGILTLSMPLAAATGVAPEDDDVVDPVRALTALMATCAAATIVDEAESNLGLYEGGPYLMGTQLSEGESRTMQLSFNAGVTYVFVGFGDADARDVDIHILDNKGDRIAADTMSDASPMVTWTPKRSGRYTVELKLYRAPWLQSSSFCSLFIMQEGGWHVPFRNCQTALEDLAKVAGYVRRHDAGRLRMSKGNCWAVNATVMREGDSSTTQSVQLEHGVHYLIGAGDRFTNDLDNSVRSSSGKTLAEDLMDDKYPISKFVGGSDSFETTIKLQRSSGASIVLQAMLTSDEGN